MAFATTIFASDGNGPANMPDKTDQHLRDHVTGSGWWNADGKLFNGLRSCRSQAAVGIGVVYRAYPNIYYKITAGETPEPPYWAKNP